MTTAAQHTTGRWMGVGESSAADAAVATRTALADALGTPSDTDAGSVPAPERGRPAVVLLFVAPAYDVSAVARTAREVLGPDVPVAGATTSGEITGTGAGSGRVVAVALGGDGLRAATSVGTLADGPRVAGERAARALLEVDGEHRALVVIGDGLSGARAEVVRGAYSVTGAGVPLIGGCAGDDLAMRATFQLHGDEVLTGAVVGVGLASPTRIAVGVGHGWHRLGEPMVVTDSDGQQILTLDDEPAAEVFLRTVGLSVEAAADPAVWQRAGLFHPIGLTRPGGEEIRAVLDVDLETMSLGCGDVPQGTVITIMRGDAGTVDQGTHAACTDLLDALEGEAPVGVVAFDCAARRAVLGDQGLAQEVTTIGGHLPGVPLAGFYTYGEFARARGARGVHNATLALLALT